MGPEKGRWQRPGGTRTMPLLVPHDRDAVSSRPAFAAKPAMPALIRPYRDADRDAIIAAFRSNVPEHFPASEEAWLVSALEEPDGPFFVIEDDGEVVGCGGYELSDFYNLGTLVFGLLRADRHRTGLGRMLLLHRLLAMAEDPMRPRYVTIDTHPHVAGFYLRHGFHEMARWSGGYRSGRDRVDLRLELTDAEVERLKAMRDDG